MAGERILIWRLLGVKFKLGAGQGRAGQMKISYISTLHELQIMLCLKQQVLGHTMGTMYRYWKCQGIRISSTTRSNVLPCGVENGSTYYVFCWRGSTYYITMTDDSDSDSDSESDGGDRFKEEEEIIISINDIYWIDITLLSFAPDTRYKYLPSADFLSDR